MGTHFKGLTITHINYVPTVPQSERDTITDITSKGLKAVVRLPRKKIFFFFSKAAVSKGTELMVRINLPDNQEVVRASGPITFAERISDEGVHSVYTISMNFVLINETDQAKIHGWLASETSGKN
ncbi:MAG: hypothetical protein JW734_05460 [Candidatus Omnitrophica bacterium]|nr:hypothetical protein [Candidatus Omnitrophota bacterium]